MNLMHHHWTAKKIKYYQVKNPPRWYNLTKKPISRGYSRLAKNIYDSKVGKNLYYESICETLSSVEECLLRMIVQNQLNNQITQNLSDHAQAMVKLLSFPKTSKKLNLTAVVVDDPQSMEMEVPEDVGLKKRKEKKRKGKR
ncbi:hypothetical protein ACJX0J_032587 [Zea mays]